MAERKLRTARIVSVIAATVISLACGTNVGASETFRHPHLLTKYIVCLFSLGSGLCGQVEALLDPEQFDSMPLFSQTLSCDTQTS